MKFFQTLEVKAVRLSSLLSTPSHVRIIRRLALIPLMVYALGVPVEVYSHGSVFLVADGWLPYEVVGLVVCAFVALTDW